MSGKLSEVEGRIGTVHQLEAGILFRRNLLQFGIHRQQHFRLDMNQGGRHVHELGAQVHVQLPGLFHVLQILRGDGGDGNVLDIDLLPANQVQKQIERPFIMFQMDV